MAYVLHCQPPISPITYISESPTTSPDTTFFIFMSVRLTYLLTTLFDVMLITSYPCLLFRLLARVTLFCPCTKLSSKIYPLPWNRSPPIDYSS